MWKASIVFATSALTLSGCGSSASSTTAPARTAAASTLHNRNGCQTVSLPQPKGVQHLKAPTLKLDPSKTYTVNVSTNCGSFAFTLDVTQSPRTTASIYSLVKDGFYDDLTFQRVAANFVIQGGDPLGNGEGGPGYTVVEAPPQNTPYAEGDVAMAKTEDQPSGASGSQFFVFTSASGAAGLPAQYALAGKVVSGMNVVQRIGALPTTPSGDGSPSPPVVMESVTVTIS